MCRDCDLGLALGIPEVMPFTLSALRIAHVDNDSPMAGRTFAEMAFHSSFLSRSARSAAIALNPFFVSHVLTKVG